MIIHVRGDTPMSMEEATLYSYLGILNLGCRRLYAGTKKKAARVLSKIKAVGATHTGKRWTLGAGITKVH
jgi:hypothetical protein